MRSKLPDVPRTGLLWVVLCGALWSLASCASSSTVGDAGHDARVLEGGGEDSGADAETRAIDTGPVDAEPDACTDSGASCPSRCATGTSARATTPTAVLADGQVWVIWEARDTGTSDVRSDVCAARYDTSSGKLRDATRLNDNPIVTFAAVQSTSSEDGTAVASWREGDGTDRLLVSQLATRNGAWSPATAVGPAAWLQGTSLAAGSGKRTAVAWAQRDANFDVSVWASHHVADVGWLTPNELSPTSYHSVPPVVTIDADGTALVAWSAEDGLWISRFGAAADAWSPPTQLTDLSSGKLRIASHGPSTFLSWHSCTADSCAMHLARHDRANDTWVSSSFPTTTVRTNGADLSVNTEGDALIVWIQSLPEMASEGFAVYAARFEVTSGVWLEPQLVFTDTMHHASSPEATVGDDDTALVAWQEQVRLSPDDHTGHPRLRASRQAMAGASWGDAELLAESQLGELIPDVLWTPEGTLVVWAQYDQRDQPAKVQVRRVD